MARRRTRGEANIWPGFVDGFVDIASGPHVCAFHFCRCSVLSGRQATDGERRV